MRIKRYLGLAIKGKCSAYSVAERRVPELISFLAVSLQVTRVMNLFRSAL